MISHCQQYFAMPSAIIEMGRIVYAAILIEMTKNYAR